MCPPGRHAGVSVMRRFSQSIHVNPHTEEGQKILSGLLAVPSYSRGRLIRNVLARHIRDVACQLWPGLSVKTQEQLEHCLTPKASRPASRARPDARVPITASALIPPQDSPMPQNGDEDLDARLDRLNF